MYIYDRNKVLKFDFFILEEKTDLQNEVVYIGIKFRSKPIFFFEKRFFASAQVNDHQKYIYHTTNIGALSSYAYAMHFWWPK